MDKLGVLKLLGSLFDFYKQKSSSSPPENSTPVDIESMLSPLKNLVNAQNKPNSSPPLNAKAEKTPPLPPKTAPLQAKMISIMNSHDQIVDRVKNNLNKQKTQR